MNLCFRRQKLKTTFVPLRGYEKGFFERNMKKYFGNDVEWQESVDWESVRNRPPPAISPALLTETSCRDWKGSW